jgi:hypothetical protein
MKMKLNVLRDIIWIMTISVKNVWNNVNNANSTIYALVASKI